MNICDLSDRKRLKINKVVMSIWFDFFLPSLPDIKKDPTISRSLEDHNLKVTLSTFLTNSAGVQTIGSKAIPACQRL